MVIDELIAKKGTQLLPIDSYDNQVIDEIEYEGQKFHFAKQKDLTGTTEIVADNAVNEPIRELAIEGNTYQKQLTGKNIFDLSKNRYSGGSLINAKDETSITVSGNGGWQCVAIALPNDRELIGKTITISGNISKSANSPSHAGLYVRWFNGNLGVGVNSKNIGVYGANAVGDVHKSGVVQDLDFEQYPNAKLCVAFYSNTDGTNDTNASISYSNVQVEFGSTPTEYEEFCGGIPSPNPTYPQEIKNADNMSVELSGINYFNIDKITDLCNANGVPLGKNELVKYDDKFVVKVGMYGGFRGLYNSTMHLKEGQYRVSFDFENQTENNNGDVYYGIISIDKSIPNPKEHTRVGKVEFGEKKKFEYTFNISTESDYFISIQGGGNAQNYKNLNFIVSNVVIKDANFNSTVQIPSEITVNGTVVTLRFGKVDEYVDKLIVDKINNKVIYQEYTQSIKLNSNSNFGGYRWGLNKYVLNSKNENVFEIHNFPQQYFVAEKGYCNYFTKEIWYKEKDNVFFVTDFLLLFRTNGIETLDEWKARIDELEANGTPLEVLVARKTPKEYDLTNTDLGRELLALEMQKGTDIFTITSDNVPVSKTDLSYWRQTIPNE